MSAHPADHDSEEHSAMLAKGVVAVAAALITLVVGIAIGNAARKRLDRLSHGYRLM